jgi:hypothetical protein
MHSSWKYELFLYGWVKPFLIAQRLLPERRDASDRGIDLAAPQVPASSAAIREKNNER